jgi:glucose/mannose-6-phosphate isomerase
MYSIDKANFKRFLKSFPDQILESKKIFKESNIKINANKIQKIVYFGMGGSAIAGDILNDVRFSDLTVPMQVIRGYDAP